MPQEPNAELVKVLRELQVLREQGCDTRELESPFGLAGLAPEEAFGEVPEGFWESAEAMTSPEDFPYSEPSTLAAIRAGRPRAMPAALAPVGSVADRILGGWLGRIAGCMLGKPVEGWEHGRIRSLLDRCGEYPLREYFPDVSVDETGAPFPEHARATLRGRFAHAARDDDTDYTIVGLKILEDFGRDFTPEQVARFWLEHLPYKLTYTAERMAYKNFVNGIMPPESAAFRNPFREWIGAQIRADAWGYACPGRPEEAAGLAFRDACISHVKNGIYGEMFVAAMIAGAFCTEDPRQVVGIGLSQIPHKCRLAEAVENVLAWRGEDSSPEETLNRILDVYGSYHRVHTINNAAIVVMALLWGGGDFSSSIGTAVAAGLDTDCNGATVGSIVGVMVGPDNIPDRWRAPLGDRLETVVAGESMPQISDLARRTVALL